MQHFDAIIFDMDGLLLDTERLALATFHDTCRQFGFEGRSEVYLRCVGTNERRGEQILRKYLQAQVDYDAFAPAWQARYDALVDTAPVPVKAGVSELLGFIAELGLPLAVATSTRTDKARAKLAGADLLRRFDAVVGGDQVEESKPHPAIFLRAAEVLGARPEACLALEDSANGVRAALRAGMTVVQIPDLAPPSPRLRALGHVILESLHQVRDYPFAADAS